jgi:hypothetical protein
LNRYDPIGVMSRLLKGLPMAKKRSKPKCMFPNCLNEAKNHLGLRLRRAPGPNNVWTHDTDAWLCDDHARQGLAINIEVTLHSDSQTIYTNVCHESGETFERESLMRPGTNLPAQE